MVRGCAWCFGVVGGGLFHPSTLFVELGMLGRESHMLQRNISISFSPMLLPDKEYNSVHLIHLTKVSSKFKESHKI